MSAAAATKLWTVEEIDALPEDGIDRWVIRGELREERMTKRTTWHASVELRLGKLIGKWIDSTPVPHGEAYSGEIGLIMARNPDTSWGVDVMYVSPDEMAKQPKRAKYIEVRPTLVVEVLSPSDKVGKIDDRVEAYLSAGIPLVWVVHPKQKMVTVHRPGGEPEVFTVRNELSGEPHMPGFRIRVADMFSPYL